jgi:predicted  nucleic acid-binding Zn-ribbon protein
MSDTPRTDQIEKLAYWFQDDMTPVCESRFVRSLERELTTANAEIERLTNKVAQLYEGAEEAKQRIKRLEEAGDEAIYKTNLFDREEHWNKAKEAK